MTCRSAKETPISQSFGINMDSSLKTPWIEPDQSNQD